MKNNVLTVSTTQKQQHTLLWVSIFTVTGEKWKAPTKSACIVKKRNIPRWGERKWNKRPKRGEKKDALCYCSSLLVSRKSSLSLSHCKINGRHILSRRVINISSSVQFHLIQLLLLATFNTTAPVTALLSLSLSLLWSVTYSFLAYFISRLSCSLSSSSSSRVSTARTLFMFIKFRLETFFLPVSFSLSPSHQPCIACVCECVLSVLYSSHHIQVNFTHSLIAFVYAFLCLDDVNSCLCIAPPFIHLMPIDDVTTLFSLSSHHLFYVELHSAVEHKQPHMQCTAAGAAASSLGWANKSRERKRERMCVCVFNVEDAEIACKIIWGCKVW